MERRVRGNSHARCEAGENPAMTSKDYLLPVYTKSNITYIALFEFDELEEE